MFHSDVEMWYTSDRKPPPTLHGRQIIIHILRVDLYITPDIDIGFIDLEMTSNTTAPSLSWYKKAGGIGRRVARPLFGQLSWYPAMHASLCNSVKGRATVYTGRWYLRVSALQMRCSYRTLMPPFHWATICSRLCRPLLIWGPTLERQQSAKCDVSIFWLRCSHTRYAVNTIKIRLIHYVLTM